MTIEEKNKVNANDYNSAIDSKPYLKSPTTKYFSEINGVNGNAQLSRPSYQSGKDTWVTEYTYKDADVDVVIRQRVRVSAHNNQIRNQYHVENELIEISRAGALSKKEKDYTSELLDEELSGMLEDKKAENAMQQVRSQMLSDPKATIKAQAGQSGRDVLSLIM